MKENMSHGMTKSDEEFCAIYKKKWLVVAEKNVTELCYQCMDIKTDRS